MEPIRIFYAMRLYISVIKIELHRRDCRGVPNRPGQKVVSGEERSRCHATRPALVIMCRDLGMPPRIDPDLNNPLDDFYNQGLFYLVTYDGDFVTQKLK